MKHVLHSLALSLGIVMILIGVVKIDMFLIANRNILKADYYLHETIIVFNLLVLSLIIYSINKNNKQTKN